MADDAPLAVPGLENEVIRDLYARFGQSAFVPQRTQDGMPTLWVGADKIIEVLRHLKNGVAKPYKMLYDLTAVDERLRKYRRDLPASDFTVVYQLLSIERDMTRSRSEEHTSELQSLMRISYAVFCLKKKKQKIHWYRSLHD